MQSKYKSRAQKCGGKNKRGKEVGEEKRKKKKKGKNGKKGGREEEAYEGKVVSGLIWWVWAAWKLRLGEAEWNEAGGAANLS
jgi:hypothetical protein